MLNLLFRSLPLAVTGLLLSTTLLTAQSCPDEGPFGDLNKFNSYGGITQSVVPDANGVCGDAFRIQPATVQPAVWDAGFQVIETAAPVDRENVVYEVSFRYRAASNRSIQFLLNSRERGTYGDGRDHTYDAPVLQATTSYQTYRTVFTSVRRRKDRDKFSLYFLVAVGNSTTDVFLDNIIMREYVPTSRQPTTFYVSPSGNDANDGSGLSTAWRTIGHAFTQMIGGDELLLADGTYQENALVLQNLDGTAARPTVIRALNQWGAKIESTDQYAAVLQVLNCNHVVVDGLEVFNNNTEEDIDWTPGIQSFGSNYVTVQDCYAHDCGCNGFSGREGDYLTFQRNVARDNAKTNPYNCSGISIYQPIQIDNNPGPHIIIRQNVVFENECRLPFSPAGFDVPTDGNGIILDDFNWTQGSNSAFLAEALVENNLAFNNGGAGIKIYEVANATIRNNTAYHNNYVLQEFASGTGEIGAQAVTGTLTVANNITVNPVGQNSYAFAYQSFGRRGTVNTSTNLFVGRRLAEGTVNVSNDDDVAETDQSYPRFLQPTVTPPANFSSVADFAALYGLAFDSPALNTADPATAPGDDLAGNARPQDGAPDKGAFEGGGTPPPPSCDDGIQNGNETGVDCGGPDCPACPTGPTCDDGIQNGDETGVDCGGSSCPACPVSVQALPGTIQIEEFTSSNGTVSTAASGDADGTPAVFFQSSDASVNLPVDVTQPGTYNITYRVKMTGRVNIWMYADGAFIQRTQVGNRRATGNWQDITTTADFATPGIKMINIRIAEAGRGTMNYFSGQFSGNLGREEEIMMSSPSELRLFPNPAQDELNVLLPENSETVRLQNAQGQLLREQSASDQIRLRWSVGELPPGVYTVSVIGKDGARQLRRVVIQ